MAVMTILRWVEDFGKFRRGEFCLKDADTEVAEEAGQNSEFQNSEGKE
jgi:hypothetical protein